MIGTPPNILVADLAERLRGEPFTMFEFAPVGAAITVAGIVFMVAIGWRFLPRGREGTKSPTELFDIGHYVTEARLPPKSSLIGKTIREFEDASGDRAIVLGLVHGDTRLRPSSSYVLQEGDVLLLQAETEALQEYVKAAHLDLVAAAPHDPPDLPSAEAAVPMPAEAAANAASRKTEPRPAARQMLDTAEAVVTPTSWVQGSSARTLRLRARYDTNLLAISRRGRPITTRLRDVPLFAGDVLLMEGPAGDLPDTITKLGCLPLADRKLALSPRRVLLPFAVFVGAVALVIFGVTSAAIAFVLGAAAMVGLGFVPAREVYSTIEWPVIVLLAALIPVAGALETTGTATLAADALVAVGRQLAAARDPRARARRHHGDHADPEQRRDGVADGAHRARRRAEHRRRQRGVSDGSCDRRILRLPDAVRASEQHADLGRRRLSVRGLLEARPADRRDHLVDSGTAAADRVSVRLRAADEVTCAIGSRTRKRLRPGRQLDELVP